MVEIQDRIQKFRISDIYKGYSMKNLNRGVVAGRIDFFKKKTLELKS